MANGTSKVWFTDMRTSLGNSLQVKLERLLKTAGMPSIDFENKLTAIKLHFGERGNLAFIRPNFAKTVADMVKSLGGKPFLTDCNTLYVGSRKNAVDHLETAYENGFTPLSAGCSVIIADGLKGIDETLVPIDGEYVREAKIGAAVMEADVFISMTHFKGHESTGFGGALKNIGMGCGSRAGKMEQHASGKPQIDRENCVGCGTCAKYCAHDAVTVKNKKAEIDVDKCVGCGRCIGVCPKDAVYPGSGSSNRELCCKIAEYSLAVLKDRPSFHISLVMDVSPECDCCGENDAPIVPDVGMFASFDPIALDMACADAVNAAPAIPGSALGGKKHGGDHFSALHPDSEWRACLKHAEKIGLGTTKYELIRVK